MAEAGKAMRLTLTAGPADYLRGVAAALGVGPAEAARRALTVLTACVVDVTADEYLIVRNRLTGQEQRLTFEWAHIDRAEQP